MAIKCGARTTKGGACQNAAGFKTDHVGTGKCYLHGGASKGAPKGNQNALKHGIYSRLFSQQELNEAADMEGSISGELAVTRIQLARLLNWYGDNQDNPVIDQVEESTIVKEDDKKSTLRRMERSAEECGEYYDSDGDEDYVENESDPFIRKRTFRRRDFSNEYTRLVRLIASLEQQLVSIKKTKAIIKQIEAGDKTNDPDDQLTDTQLDQEISELFEGLEI